jgi:hypothetical protein
MSHWHGCADRVPHYDRPDRLRWRLGHRWGNQRCGIRRNIHRFSAGAGQAGPAGTVLPVNLTVTLSPLTGLSWKFEQPQQTVSNRPFYTKVVPAHPSAPVQLQVIHLVARADYRLEIHRTGYHANDAYSAYLEMGSPKDLTSKQVAHLMDLTRDLPVTERVVRSGSDGSLKLTVEMNSNDIVLLELRRLEHRPSGQPLQPL